MNAALLVFSVGFIVCSEFLLTSIIILLFPPHFPQFIPFLLHYSALFNSFFQLPYGNKQEINK